MRSEDSPIIISPTSLHRLTFFLQQRYDDHLVSRVGVGFAQTRIMETLHEAIPHSQRAIAHELRQTEANISRQLRLMKKKGLVRIIRNKKDGRQRDVTLTSKGLGQFEKAQKLLEAQHRELLDHLSQTDAKNFEKALERLINSLNIARKSHKPLG